ncbi:TetR/AcrR family transcriptional regulator [Acuticoccus sp. I52.16.1]|nr:TetR/AcrR family transcriptional regulator [Acuticoccus sp. I52.16.1]UOM34101.1 TetR/AcrR family transcriptional regulator [Acuticoccus sp. I52.16.1]
MLEAAAAVFSAGGPDASLEAVARTAGVGIGTLYRHFPTREALFQAVYRHEVDELVEAAERLTAEAEPLAGLRTWLRAAVRMVATKKGMVAALAPAIDNTSPFYADNAARVGGALAALMGRAVAAGELRDEVSPEELLRTMLGLCYMGNQPPDWQDSVVRLLDVFLDGLCARPRAQ